MDYFESLVATIIEKENKWVKQNVKVNLTKEEKVEIGKPSIPRPDIDIVAYRAKENVLEIWEVKSFLDSPGVRFKEIIEENEIAKGRYKLLTSEKYRMIIIDRLVADWIELGLINKNPTVKIGLAAGKIYSNDEDSIVAHFKKKGWILKTPMDLFRGIEKLEEEAYENDLYIIAAKLIFRNVATPLEDQ